MSSFFTIYMTLWISVCLAAMYFAFKERGSLEFLNKPYWTGLLQSWKVATFLVALTSFIFIAPYTGDPTWDYVDAAFMSILTYLTAPWSVAICYLFIRKQRKAIHFYIAVCLWLFSTSWSYDLYILLRDGSYPLTWLSNIALSSILYLSAGLLWNLEKVEGRGVIFSFMDDNWPTVNNVTSFSSIVWYAVPFIILVAVMILSFVF